MPEAQVRQQQTCGRLVVPHIHIFVWGTVISSLLLLLLLFLLLALTHSLTHRCPRGRLAYVRLPSARLRSHPLHSFSLLSLTHSLARSLTHSLHSTPMGSTRRDAGLSTRSTQLGLLALTFLCLVHSPIKIGHTHCGLASPPRSVLPHLSGEDC